MLWSEVIEDREANIIEDAGSRSSAAYARRERRFVCSEGQAAYWANKARRTSRARARRELRLAARGWETTVVCWL